MPSPARCCRAFTCVCHSDFSEAWRLPFDAFQKHIATITSHADITRLERRSWIWRLGIVNAMLLYSSAGSTLLFLVRSVDASKVLDRIRKLADNCAWPCNCFIVLENSRDSVLVLVSLSHLRGTGLQGFCVYNVPGAVLIKLLSLCSFCCFS